jgi:glycosyltransferase involved in cell wall biosynthesis
MRRGRYDVVHVHLYRACIYGRIAARLARVPVVVTTEHSIGEELIEDRRKSWYLRSMYLMTERLSDVTVAVAPVVQERLIRWGVPESKIRVIPNGLDFERFAFDTQARKALREEFGISPGDFVMGSSGRFIPRKHYDILIQSAVPLLRSGAWLLLVGDGPERARLRAIVRQAGVAGRVVFAGERTDVPRLLSAMDLFVAPFTEETFTIAALEAVASGLRVICTECPALDGLQGSGVRWVPAEVLHLRRALSDEWHAGEPRSRQAYEAVRRRYDIRDVAARLGDLYEALLVG